MALIFSSCMGCKRTILGISQEGYCAQCVAYFDRIEDDPLLQKVGEMFNDRNDDPSSGGN